MHRRVEGIRLARNGASSDGGPAEITVVCPDCSTAIHVSLEAYVDGGTADCPDCEASPDLAEVGDGLPSRDVLLDRLPAEAREALAPVLSEFPSSG